MPVYRTLPIEDCIIDPRYQREKIEPHIERIKNDFDEAQFSVLEASARDNGEFAIFDGQQRLEARLRRIREGMENGKVLLPSLVHEGLTPEQEAELFVELQRNRRSITPIERFKARAFYNDPIAVGMTELAAKFRYKIGTGPQSIQAVVACERAYRRGNLDKTFKVIDVWRGDPGALDAPLLQGVSRFLDLYENEVNIDTAKFVFGDVAPKTVLRRAPERMSSSKAGGVLLELRDLYSNKDHPLPTVEKAIANRVVQERESGRRYVRFSREQVRDAVFEVAAEKPDGFRVTDVQEKLGGISKAALTNQKTGHLHRMRKAGTLRRRYPRETEPKGFIYVISPVERATVNRRKRRPPEMDPPAGQDAPRRGEPVRLVSEKERRRSGSKPGEGKRVRDRDREFKRQQTAREARSAKDKAKSGARKKEPVSA